MDLSESAKTARRLESDRIEYKKVKEMMSIV